MNFIRKASRILFKVLEWFAMVCMVVLALVVFLDVILRYVFNQGFSWTQEMATLMLAWISLVGMAIGVLEKLHINIEMFTAKLPAKALSALESLNHIIIAAFGGAMVYFGIIIMDMTKKSTMPATKLPSSVLYIILPLSGLLILVNALLVASKQHDKIFDKPAIIDGKEDTHG